MSKSHLWTCTKDCDSLVLHTRCEIPSHIPNLTKHVHDYMWSAVPGVENNNIQRYQMTCTIALFYRTRNDIQRIMETFNNILGLGEPNIVGLEEVPEIKQDIVDTPKSPSIVQVGGA